MIAQNLVEALTSGLGHIADVETIIGQPIEAGGVTLIPVISVSGYVMGGGRARGAAAGGFRADPVAMVVIRDAGVEVLPLCVAGPGATNALDLLPQLISAFSQRGEDTGKPRQPASSEQDPAAAAATGEARTDDARSESSGVADDRDEQTQYTQGGK